MPCISLKYCFKVLTPIDCIVLLLFWKLLRFKICLSVNITMCSSWWSVYLRVLCGMRWLKWSVACVMNIHNASATWKHAVCLTWLLISTKSTVFKCHECVRKRTEYLISVALSGDQKRWVKNIHVWLLF